MKETVREKWQLLPIDHVTMEATADAELRSHKIPYQIRWQKWLEVEKDTCICNLVQPPSAGFPRLHFIFLAVVKHLV